MEEFLKGEPKVLGAVQVMIALINLSIGIIMINIPFDHREPAISLILAAPAWGPLMFIISGSLSISAGMKPTKRLVTISLVFNTISAVLAAAASIMGVISVILGLRSPFLKNEVETGCCNSITKSWYDNNATLTIGTTRILRKNGSRKSIQEPTGERV